jgi:anthranilate synthase component 2
MSWAPPRRVAVIDNYDSFTFNLVQYLLELGATVDVFANDAVTARQLLGGGATHVVLSPGPGRPRDSGVCLDIALASASAPVAVLGVCLGHQTLCAAFGADVVAATRIMHGKVSHVFHEGAGLFEGIASPFRAMRYHSLIVAEDTLPACLIATARSERGELMAVAHRELPLFGVQFHPESIASEHGHRLLANFLAAPQEGR